ncbi:SMI1/KNR4 family protein [Deinococcus altitudinis]|uniref:SMI1/KNR4 family protein n=1 Tax=Deinococcus altitudinis TaxID=468914 RepID=UPI003892300E
MAAAAAGGEGNAGLSAASGLDAYFGLPFAWNPPATQEELRSAESALQMSWLPELEAMYRQHNGASALATDWEEDRAERLEEDEDAAPAAPRLMSLEEVQDFYTGTNDFLIPEVRFFWTDDNSNYVGVYVGDILTGAVCFCSHDEQTEVAPIFRTLADFLVWVSIHPEEDLSYSELVPKLYPVLTAESEHLTEDWRNAQALYAKVTNQGDADSQTLAVAMNITPPSYNQVLMSYLDSPDFYVAERAVNILGARRYQPARTRIENLAVHGVSNAQSAAQWALKRWSWCAPRSPGSL